METIKIYKDGTGYNARQEDRSEAFISGVRFMESFIPRVDEACQIDDQFTCEWHDGIHSKEEILNLLSVDLEFCKEHD